MFIIGGEAGDPLGSADSLSDIVAQFKNNQWTRLANLNQGRQGHGVITIGEETMIIAGLTFPE